ncbi:MAG: caspase family protein [Saprospiraceae bacterium]|nr:caspase family protein [Saprospiraceae bacterium]
MAFTKANTNSPPTRALRRTRLMLIGIDKYEHWDALSYPVSDCEGFFQVLQQHYGFTEQDLIHTHQRPLYNEDATTDMIYDELHRLLDNDETGNPHISAEDNLIVYFAGHGHLDKTVDEGYWVPVDAPRSDRPSDLKKLISVSEVVKILSAVPARHIVLIVDACFPQSFARMPVDVPPGGTPNNPEAKPSRWALTSGRLEEVADQSPFAEALRDLLENNDKPRLSIFTLGAGVKERVQNAWSGSLTENRYDGGEFFFYRQSPLPMAELAPWSALTEQALAERMRHGSQQYLRRLKSGRFKHLRIEKLLLTETNLPDFVDTQVKVQEELTPLHKAVSSLWGQEQPHAVVLGEGGMGKTVSLLRLWEDLLDEPAVPIFVALNEYNAAPESEKRDFVLRSIARNCGLAESLTEDWKNALWNLIRQPRPDGSPAILLLLDGFNEVTAERTLLLIELNRIAQEARGVQMVVSSRYVEIRNFQWAQQSEIMELQPLPEAAIAEYLNELGLSLSGDEALRRLLGNPMMLTIYAGSSEIARRHAADTRFRFLPSQSVGELLWNFTEAQLVKYYEDNAHDPDAQTWHRFLLRCLLPCIAYRMEEHGDFFLAYGRRTNPEFNFKVLIDEAFTVLNHPELTEIFPEFEGKRRYLGLSELPDLDAREQRARRVREYLVDKLHLLVFEKEELRFLHQNFRDFFAACYLLNEAAIATAAPVGQALPTVWTNRTLPVYLRRIVGHLEGEHYFNPKKYAAKQSMPGYQDANRLFALLSRCRGVFHHEPTQYAVWNVLKILSDTRGTLAGANLSHLDLSKLYLNGIPLSHHLGQYCYHPAQIDGSMLNGMYLFPQGHRAEVWSVCYSPDGKKIVSGSSDKTMKEWSVDSGECLQTFTGHSGIITSVCYSPDGKRILSGSGVIVTEWCMESGKCLRDLAGHSDVIRSVCYSPDGNKVLSGSDDGTIKEWSVENGACIRTFYGHSYGVNSVRYNSDGKKVLSGHLMGSIMVWSVESGECLQTFQGHHGMVSCVCYSPDEKKILSGSWDNTVKEWSVETGECLQTLKGHYSEVNSVCYSPDGKKILSGAYSTIIVWLVETGDCHQALKGHSSDVTSVCYSPNGKTILSGSSDKMIKEWLVDTGECLQTLKGYSNEVISICYSPDEKKVLSGSWDNMVKEWSVETSQCLQILKGHSNEVTSVCYSPDGKKILSGAYDETVREWLVETGQCLRILKVQSGWGTSVCYSPNGKKILSGTYDNIIGEWLVETGECLQTFSGHSEDVISVCYSPDGKKIVSGAYDNIIIEWSVETGKCLQSLKGHSNDVVSVCYSPDGRKILSGSQDKTIREWLVDTGECLQTLKGHIEGITSVCYSPDGKKILSSAWDKTVKEWLVETGECLRTLRGHSSYIIRVCYNRDGKRILSGSSDNTINEWSVETGECLQTLFNETGLFVRGLDLSHLHPDSIITEEEQERLRQYGAIFNEADRSIWEETIAEARASLENTSEQKP